MKEADVRIGTLDDFTVEFEHQTQNPMSRRMLRSKIDREIADTCRSHDGSRSSPLATRAVSSSFPSRPSLT